MKINFCRSVGFYSFFIVWSCTTPEEEKRIAYANIQIDNDMNIQSTAKEINKLLGELNELFESSSPDQQNDICCIENHFIINLNIKRHNNISWQFQSLVTKANSYASSYRIGEIINEISNANTFPLVRNPDNESFKVAKNKIVKILNNYLDYTDMFIFKMMLDRSKN